MSAFPWFILVAICILSHGNLSGGCIAGEREALLKFKSGLTDASNRLASWAADGDCCEWNGVVCSNISGHVIELHLRTISYLEYFGYTVPDYSAASIERYKRIQFGGKISDSLVFLKNLRHLDLSGNDFLGIPIPKFLGSIRSLRYLNLSISNFGEMIPPQLGNLSNLRYLDLQNDDDGEGYVTYVENLHWFSGLSSLKYLDMSHVNLSRAFDWLQVTSSLPSLGELHLSYCLLDNNVSPLHSVNFSSLSILDLSGNSFSEIPIWVFSLQNLISLNLEYNSFVGPIPDALQNMTSLRELQLGNNHFNSSIPEWLFNFSCLELLDLGFNSLQGEIPSSVGNMTCLVNLDLSLNYGLEGKITGSFKNLHNLRSLIFDYIKLNQDTSSIFEILSRLNRLESLRMSSCRLSGYISSHIGQFKHLVELDLSRNSIAGPIPETIGELSSLMVLNLGHNKLNGSLPVGFGALKMLKGVAITNNSLEGQVSEVHFANLTNLIIFYASGNRLMLRVDPAWVPPFQRIVYLIMSSWSIGPQFPTWLPSLKDLRYLDLSSSNISDSIPISFLNMSARLVNFNLSHNQIHGNIPFISSDDSTISVIDLSSNLFEGPLPQISSNPANLDLSHNFFSGSISNFLCSSMVEQNDIKILNLANNLLSGEIADCWSKWKNLTAINLKNNDLSGNIPKSIGALSFLRSLNLHNNSLSGEIPSSIGNLKLLKMLDFGENDLEGEVPTWLGRQIPSIIILNLRANNFHGHIPKQLCEMSSLQVLDLADNSLNGVIPECIMNISAMVEEWLGLHGEILFYPTDDGDVEFVESSTVIKNGQMYEYSTTLNLVRILDLSNNRLSGGIPEEITRLKALQSLNLSHNLLTGEIPDDIGDMKELQFLDLSTNHLSGKIPGTVSGLTFLSNMNLSNNELSGKIPSSTQIQGFDPSCFMGNDLCGLPLTNTCSLIGAVLKNESEEYRDEGWFYVYISIAVGFVLGFWFVVAPLAFNIRWRYAYFNYLDHMWNKIIVWFHVNVVRVFTRDS